MIGFGVLSQSQLFVEYNGYGKEDILLQRQKILANKIVRFNQVYYLNLQSSLKFVHQ